jgi:DNA phosphorothioation-dependent restriction protein DptH
LTRPQQRLRSIVIDYTDGFLPLQIEARFRQTANPKDHFVITDRLPLNPFRRQRQVIDPSVPAIEETPFKVATRVASIFSSVFDTVDDQQSSALIRVLESGIEPVLTSSGGLQEKAVLVSVTSLEQRKLGG